MLLVMACAACGGDDDVCEPVNRPVCEDADARPWSEIHSTIVAGSCGRAGPSCHGADSETNELLLHDEDEAFDLLQPYLAGGPCSEMAERITSDDPFVRMPPAGTLPREQVCAILRWIDADTPR